MAATDMQAADTAFEECIDRLDELIATLDGFPSTALAFALRAHLSGVLQALLDRQTCAPAEVERFLAELRREVLQPRAR